MLGEASKNKKKVNGILHLGKWSRKKFYEWKQSMYKGVIFLWTPNEFFFSETFSNVLLTHGV